MGFHKSTGGFKPFANLGALMRDRLPACPEKPAAGPKFPCSFAGQPSDPEVDAHLFALAMADVTPLKSRTKVKNSSPPPSPSHGEKSSDNEVLRLLKELIQGGKGFVVSLTSEYVEGSAPGVPPRIAERLHNGEFSIQDHVDLHGLGVKGARDEFHRFMKRSVRTGKSGVLIVHGRGLCSARAPVLKAKVCKWLTTGYWRRYVIAFSSARMCDGGPGATYVLLRDRPVSGRKKSRIKK